MDKLKELLFKTFVADALMRAAYARVDAELTKRWPHGWPRIQFAMRGWVTKLGVVIGGVAAATLWLTQQMSAEDAARLVMWVGVGVTGLGLLRKLLKWWVYFEATDKDGWLDDPKAKKPDGFDARDKALVAGKLDEAQADLKEAAASVDAAARTVTKPLTRKR